MRIIFANALMKTEMEVFISIYQENEDIPLGRHKKLSASARPVLELNRDEAKVKV